MLSLENHGELDDYMKLIPSQGEANTNHTPIKRKCHWTELPRSLGGAGERT